MADALTETGAPPAERIPAPARAKRRTFRIHFGLANILLAPLQRLAAPTARLVAPAARVVLSGLLASQVNAALAAYRAHGLALERRIQLGGWATLLLRRRPAKPVTTSRRMGCIRGR